MTANERAAVAALIGGDVRRLLAQADCTTTLLVGYLLASAGIEKKEGWKLTQRLMAIDYEDALHGFLEAAAEQAGIDAAALESLKKAVSEQMAAERAEI